jgi:addiction module HigA family antidote
MIAPDPEHVLAPVHPGEILLEEFLRPHGLTAYSAAARLHVPRTRIERVVRGDAPISVDTARRLARLFGTTEAFWMNLQLAFDLASEPAGADLAQIKPMVA